MGKNAMGPRRSIILDQYMPRTASGDRAVVPGRYVDGLRGRGVSTIFVVTSEAIEWGPYTDLITGFRDAGFRVRTIHLERLDERALAGMRKIVGEIHETFSREGCLVLSYGISLAPVVIACYYVLAGGSPSGALRRVMGLESSFPYGPDDVVFIYKFSRRLHAAMGMTDDDYIFPQHHAATIGPGGSRACTVRAGSKMLLSKRHPAGTIA